MLTRRSFLGTVAALAVSPVAPKAAPVAAELRLGPVTYELDYRYGWMGNDHVPRRDDGATILELR